MIDIIKVSGELSRVIYPEVAVFDIFIMLFTFEGDL